MSEEEYSKTFDPDFKPTGLRELIGKYKQIVKLAKNNREQYTHCRMSNKNQREASVLHWLLFLEETLEKTSLEKKRTSRMN